MLRVQGGTHPGCGYPLQNVHVLWARIKQKKKGGGGSLTQELPELSEGL